MSFKVPRNIPGVLGLALFGASMVAFAFLFLVDLFQGRSTDPYAGLFAWVVLPAVGAIGLALFGLGHWLRSRARAAGRPAGESVWDVRSLENQQSALLVTGILGAVVVFLMSAGGVRAIEYSESNDFCGEVCHPVMKPEAVAYLESPHANVHCVNCHVGSGAGNFVRAKMQGVRQLVGYMSGSYDRPIHTPVDLDHNVCQSCHWPERDLGVKPLSKRYYLTEGFDEPWVIEMSLKIGGGSADRGYSDGAHWHMNFNEQVKFTTLDDKRQVIASVTHTDADGDVTVYRNEDLDEEQEAMEPSAPLQFNCLTCHNRPAHRFESPVFALNKAFDKGRIDPNMPGVRWLGLELLAGEYETTSEALETIAEEFPAGVADEDEDWVAENAAELQQAVLMLQEIFETNRSPEMHVKWDTHPDNLRHWGSNGCFRCHAGNMVADNGSEISSSCDTCHLIKGQGRVADGSWQYDPNGMEFIHPSDEEVMTAPILCSECHDGALGYGF